MKIIILGAGQVGGTLAEHLSIEANDITLVDSNSARLAALQEKSDIRVVVGHAAYPNTLRAAGIEDTDMLVAVTNSDETNMLACQVAHSLFKTPSKIARVRSLQFLELQKIFKDDAIPVDVLISPEQLVTDFVKKLIEYPGSLQVLDFAHGRVLMVAIRAAAGASLIGKTLSALPTILPNLETRIVAIFRHGQAVPLNGNTAIELNDEVFFLAAAPHIRQIMATLRPIDNPYRRIIIAGGGNVGTRLAQSLENDYLIKIIEKDPERSKLIAQSLHNTLVLRGDAADRALLLNENIEETDVFCALTNDDEANIMAALMAKKLGARKVMAIITKPAYVELIEGGPIDIAISPQQATISGLLSHVRQGDIVKVHTLRRGAAEAIEVVAHGTPKNSKVIGHTIEQLRLPRGTTIGAIVRTNKIIIAHHDTVIEPDDHVILFLANQRHIGKIEQLFQVGLSFF